MLKVCLTSTVISNILYTILYRREERKDSFLPALLVVVVHIRYVKTWSPSVNNNCTKCWCFGSFWWKGSKMQGQQEFHRVQPGDGAAGVFSCAAGLWCFCSPGVQFAMPLVHGLSAFNSVWCYLQTARGSDICMVQLTTRRTCSHTAPTTSRRDVPTGSTVEVIYSDRSYLLQLPALGGNP